MKISEKKRDELYRTFADKVMDLRIELNLHSVKDLDDRLFQLELSIWDDVKKVLNLED